MDNMPFLLLSSFCLTSFAQYSRFEQNHAVAVSMLNKYPDPFINEDDLNSSVLLKIMA
jgi:hypothetical protein